MFVNLHGESAQPTYDIVPSQIVATQTNYAKWLGGVGRGGKIRKDTSMRKFWDEESKYLGAWELLDL